MYPVVKRDALKDLLKKHLFGNLVKVTWHGIDSKIFSWLLSLTLIVCTCSLASSTSDRLKAYLKAPRFLLCSVGKSITLRKNIFIIILLPLVMQVLLCWYGEKVPTKSRSSQGSAPPVCGRFPLDHERAKSGKGVSHHSRARSAWV